MIRGLLIFILLITSAIVGVWLYQDPGYLLFSYQGWVVETSLWVVVVGVILSVALLLLVNGLLSSCVEIFKQLFGLSNKYKRQQGELQTNQALLALSENNWARAMECAVGGLEKNTMPLINYLSAARAAHELGNYQKRNHYLSLAEKVPDAKIPVGLIRAQCQFHQQELTACFENLKKLEQLSPRHPMILQMLLELCDISNNWQEQAQLLKKINRLKLLPQERMTEITVKNLQQQLKLAANKSQEKLEQNWRKIDKKYRYTPIIVETYVNALLDFKDYVAAEKMIEKALKKNFDDRIVKLYGFIQVTGHKQLSRAENWLKYHPKNPVLLLTLARLCLHQQLWGRARDYLEASVALSPTPEAYAELGRLLGYLGEPDRARECYQQGLLSVTSVLNLEYQAK